MLQYSKHQLEHHMVHHEVLPVLKKKQANMNIVFSFVSIIKAINPIPAGLKYET
jgi:hypothetical protein